MRTLKITPSTNMYQFRQKEPQMAANTLSSVREFFDCLSFIAQGPHEVIDPEESGIATVRLIRRLKEDGLVSTGPITLQGAVYEAEITPAGAVALAQWGDLLESKSWRSRALFTLDRLVWLVIGALVGNIGFFLS